MRLWLISFLWLAVFAAAIGLCAAEDLKSYPAVGMVVSVAPDHRQVTIQHQAISNYMSAMTMAFAVRNTNELKGIVAGDEVSFQLTVSSDDSWVEQVHRTGHSTAQTTKRSAPVKIQELEIGDPMPDYELMTESGRHLHLSDFRGEAVALTFFFTRCPLPNYCPLMNRNFAQARQLLLARINGPTHWQFLSISFDPEFDNPQVLANYASLYRQTDTNNWLFASVSKATLTDLSPRLDLMVMPGAGGISHNLRTVVLDPTGRLYRQFDGNQWTPAQLSEAVIAAANRAANP